MATLSTPATAPVAAAEPRLGMAQDPAAMRKAAEKFEAQVLSALLKPGFDAAAPKGAFTGGEAEGQWRPMLVDAYAEAWVKRGGIGLAHSVMAEMLRMQSAGGGAPSGPAAGAASAPKVPAPVTGTAAAAAVSDAADPADNTSSTPSHGESVP